MGTALEPRQIRAERLSLAPATPCRARVAIRRSRSNDFASASGIDDPEEAHEGQGHQRGRREASLDRGAEGDGQGGRRKIDQALAVKERKSCSFSRVRSLYRIASEHALMIGYER